MKKVTVLDKSTLSRHFSHDTENVQSNYSNEPGLSKESTHYPNSQSRSQTQSQEPSGIGAGVTFNPHLHCRTDCPRSVPSQPIRLGVVPNTFTTPRRHMYSKAADRAFAINERIERMARKWTDLESAPCTYEELSHPTRASPDEIITVGRIVCDSDAKLNENSVLLESSRSIGSGARVLLNLSTCPSYSIFPGQIVLVQGVNPDGKCLHVNRFLHPGNPLIKIPKLPEACGQYEKFADGVLSVMVASGPFTLDSRPDARELNFSPLDDLFACVVSKRPEVLVLCGPFIDTENSAVQTGSLHFLPDQIFHLEIGLRLSELKQKLPEIRIVLVPSLKDAHSSMDFVYPQPPLQNLKLDNGIVCVSNPSLFFINELCFSVSSNDILFPLAQQSISRSSADRMTLISSHLLEQSSLSPLMPSATGANLDYSMLDQLEFPFTPDVIVSPSALAPFARAIDSDSVCLNPGSVCRKVARGTASILSFNQPKSNSRDCVAERLRIDFIQF